jgi:hypothetical protein
MSADEVSEFSTLKSRRTEIICREVDGRLVGLDLRSSHYFSLNPNGTLLWRLLEEGTTADDLVKALIAQNSLSTPAATADVETFLASLHEQHLLE